MQEQHLIGPLELGNQLGRLEGHIGQANEWAERRLQMFPNLSSVSIQLGVAFGLQFSVMLTWSRSPQGTIQRSIEAVSE